MAENIPMSDSGLSPDVRRFRRLVTGIDAEGRSYFVEDAEAADVFGVAGIEGYAATNFWRTPTVPVDNTMPHDDGLAEPGRIAPPPTGAVFRAVQFAPDSRWIEKQPELEKELYHSTPSLDFAVVLDGEVVAVLDKEERVMKRGDVLIQRGTAHGWLNRTEEPAIVAFVLIGGSEALSPVDAARQ